MAPNPDRTLEAKSIESIITQFIKVDLHAGGDNPIDMDDNIFTAGLVDSIGIVRLVAHLEDTLGIRIPPKDLVPSNFRTIRTMAEYLERQTGS